MAFFKCKMCGGTIEFESGATVGVCDSCGTKQTLPRLDDDRKANLYDRANHFRRNNDYDKAMSIYEQILNEDNADAESYWSILLCRYGIEYVEDPATHKHLPTINRAQYTSVFDDEDYKSALRYADEYQREIYEAEAQQINEIQKGILAISQQEEPFDVFICYKETDANGRRTQDSVLATELYHELTKDGFKVFFSRITLEDKLGTAYEPYIFAALNSAKVMVVLGTRQENFNAVWVKNEWSRYLALIKNGAKKVLIPAYRDMDPYDLPDEFSHLQAQDMSKLGFMQDLTRGIKKILESDTLAKAVKETVIQATLPTNVVPLLKRAFMFLEDGEYDRADEFCEQVLNQDPECAEAYLGKLLAELQVKKKELLVNCKEPFDDSNNYQKAVRFDNGELSTLLKDYVLQIKNRNAEKAETDRKNGIYSSAISQKSDGTSRSSRASLERAIDLFDSISGWKDADEQIIDCQKKIEEIKIKEETAHLEAERKAEEHRIAAEKAAKKRKKVISITTPSVVACIAFLIVLNTVIIPKQKLNKAMSLLDSGDYDSAYALLEEIGNTDAIASSKYDRAVALMDSCDYEPAYKLLNDLSYKDSNDKVSECLFMVLKANLSDVKKGDTVKFGFYEQDNNTTNGKEEIEWTVLNVKGNKALVISKYALDCRQYNTSYTDITWEKCTLRTWLNDSFLNEAFGTEHQKLIPSVSVSAYINPEYGTNQGNATTDQVFLLSITEVEKYFTSDEDRKCVPTAYAIAQGAYTSSSDTKGGKATCWWWLRSPGADQLYAAYVSLGGSVNYFGDRVSYDGDAVRPALWINLE